MERALRIRIEPRSEHGTIGERLLPHVLFDRVCAQRWEISSCGRVARVYLDESLPGDRTIQGMFKYRCEEPNRRRAWPRARALKDQRASAFIPAS